MNLTRGINMRKIAEVMPGASGAEVKVRVTAGIMDYWQTVWGEWAFVCQESVSYIQLFSIFTSTNNLWKLYLLLSPSLDFCVSCTSGLWRSPYEMYDLPCSSLSSFFSLPPCVSLSVCLSVSVVVSGSMYWGGDVCSEREESARHSGRLRDGRCQGNQSCTRPFFWPSV